VRLNVWQIMPRRTDARMLLVDPNWAVDARAQMAFSNALDSHREHGELQWNSIQAG
jgi:hypothetical protein